MKRIPALVFGFCTLLAACNGLVPSAPPVVDRLGLADLSLRVEAGDFGKISALVVSQDGEIVFEDYFRRSRPGSVVDMRSAGKSLTAIAVGIAIDDDVIAGVETPAFSIFEDRAPFRNDGPGKRAIMLGELLSMTSALACDDWDPRSPGNEERMYRTRDWTAFALDLPVMPAPGETRTGPGRFSYCTAGVFLIGQMLERLTEQKFDSYVATRIFAPLGIDGAEWRRSASGEVQSGGQLGLRARDAERIGRLVLNEGVWDGQRIVSRSWISQMLAPRSYPRTDLGYGFLWWRADLGTAPSGRAVEAAMMIGNGGNLVAVLPSLDAVIVVQATNYNRPGDFEISYALLRRFILPALLRSAEARTP